MQYISQDGEKFNSLAEARLHNLKLKVDSITDGKVSEFEETMRRETSEAGNHFTDAWIDWSTGYVRMYNSHGTEILAVKIDTEYYRRGMSPAELDD